MGAIYEHCREVLIREEREEGNLCFECFEAQVLETTPEDEAMEKINGRGE